MKKESTALQDNYIIEAEKRKKLKIKQCSKKEKAKQNKLKIVLGKRQLKSIRAVEYNVNSTIVRTSTQFKIEKAIIDKNLITF